MPTVHPLSPPSRDVADAPVQRTDRAGPDSGVRHTGRLDAPHLQARALGAFLPPTAEAC